MILGEQRGRPDQSEMNDSEKEFPEKDRKEKVEERKDQNDGRMKSLLEHLGLGPVG